MGDNSRRIKTASVAAGLISAFVLTHLAIFALMLSPFSSLFESLRPVWPWSLETWLSFDELGMIVHMLVGAIVFMAAGCVAGKASARLLDKRVLPGVTFFSALLMANLLAIQPYIASIITRLFNPWALFSRL